MDETTIEAHARRIGAQLLHSARQHQPASHLTDTLMDTAMADPAFKTQLFRFIDVFPVLHSGEQVYQHLREYLYQRDVHLPTSLRLALKAGGLFRGALRWAIGSQIDAMARRFIAGVDEHDALPRLGERWREGIGFSIDMLGEACLSEVEADAYRQRYLRAIDVVADATAHWPDQPSLSRDHVGAIPRGNVSVKITALAAKVDPADQRGTLDRLSAGLAPVLETAGRRGVFINFDMEQYALKDLTIDLFMQCCERFAFEGGLAIQAYLRDAEQDVQRIIDWSQRNARPITVRLVKGAYWDYETIEAERRNWPVPVWSSKAQTDACFERLTRRLLQAAPRRADEGGVRLALGSHNARSIAYGLGAAEHLGLPPEAVEIQMLYGMAEGLKRAAVARGLRLREYVPVGALTPGMAYLVRRLLENTSNESWLQAGFHHDAPDEQLLARPEPTQQPATWVAENPERHRLTPQVEGVGDGRPFFNEPLRDFSRAAQRERFASAIATARRPEVANATTAAQAGDMVARAAGAFDRWRLADPVERARCLTRAAAIFRAQRDELAGIVLDEAGKPWRHADADVCEAIDFCEYDARQAVGLFRPRRLGNLVGERNEQWHVPRGPAVVISPWNFPMAIACGMTVAALVTGNPVILKPAEQTPGIALRICEALWAAGVPRDVLQFAPGIGETVGAALVRDPRVALIAFTGSKAVGLDILRAAGDTSEQQRHVKQVVCEMGGKNAIIVDDSADLDEAVPAVVASAFGYSGQRCSACSRVIVLESIHDAFVARLIEATRQLVIADPRDPACDVGPLIDDDAGERVRLHIAAAEQQSTCALAMQPPPGLEAKLGRPIIGPHIFTDVQPQHRLANEEVFGPVLAVMRARDLDQALRIANGVDYRLTGGIFSRTPSHLEQAKRQFMVGNLYLNRDIVGALVGRQPFGGFGLSGTGTQAGGDDYLRHFVLPRTCSENTMRRGFAPGLPG